MRNDQVIAHLPIDKHLPRLILDCVRKYFLNAKNQPYLEKLYSAMFSAGFYGLFRAGELARGPHVILVCNTHIGINKNKFLFVLKSSKTHDNGSQPQRIKISELSKGKRRLPKVEKYCPFNILKNYLQVWPASRSCDEQFFAFSDGSAVQPSHLIDVLKRMILKIGLQPNLYNIHLLRIGMASQMMKQGISVETIKKIGRWKSNAMFAYLCD